MLAEIFLRHREEIGRQKGLVEGREIGYKIGREKARQLIAARLDGTTTTEEMLAEVDRLIVEARLDTRRHLASRMGRMSVEERLAEINRLVEKGRREERQQIVSRLERMTAQERLAEIDRLIAEARKSNAG